MNTREGTGKIQQVSCQKTSERSNLQLLLDAGIFGCSQPLGRRNSVASCPAAYRGLPGKKTSGQRGADTSAGLQMKDQFEVSLKRKR